MRVAGVVNYYERHLGDYAKDTAHLSLLEHGAYTLLLDRYYSTEAPIPADQAHRVARARSKEERAAVDAVLAEFFVLKGGVWISKRAEEEIEKARVRISTAQANGKLGGRPKKTQRDTQRDTQQKPDGFSLGSISETQQKALQTPDSRHQRVLSRSSPDTTVSASTARARELARDDGGEGVSRETFEAIRAAYPPGLYRAADWLIAEREIRRRADEGTPLDALLSAAQAYAEQQVALEKAGTQYVLKPSAFFGPGGDWRGPFPLPAKPETAMDRLQRMTGATTDDRVIEHEQNFGRFLANG